MIVSVAGITKTYGANKVLEDISFFVEEGEKTAVVGKNGAGKTTLFRIMAGIEASDSGTVALSANASISYLEQNISYNSELTVYEEMLTAFETLIDMEKKLRELEILMGGAKGENYHKLAKQYTETADYFEANNGYSYKSLARGVIGGLGLSKSDSEGKKVKELSGGQKTRVKLGVTLLKKPDILLLDEPTNHLDMEAISWLEGYLKSYGKTVMVISHDRYFLDSVVSKVIDIENGKAKVYTGNYTGFVQKKRQYATAMEKRYKDQQKEIKKQEDSIRLLKSYNRQKTVKRAESKEKNLNKIDRLEKPVQTQNMHFSLTPKIESGFDVLSVSNISKSFGSRLLFKDISFDIKKEEKVALIGENGIGKTTILKIITNQLGYDSGFVKNGVNVKIGYFDQERQNLKESKTIIEHIKDEYPRLNDTEIRNMLAAFLFKGDDVYKYVKALSGGERGRLCLAIIMLKGANFLILDEPTNHLDMDSKEVLEEALSCFKGTMLYVSHDRYFINKTATRVLELTKEGISNYLGNYDYYIKKKTENEEKEEGITKQTEKPQKNLWLGRKAESANMRKKAAALKRIEREIELTEEKINECDMIMCKKEVFTNAAKAKEVYDEKTALEEKLESLYAQWEETDLTKI